jgi:hypothetical protein
MRSPKSKPELASQPAAPLHYRLGLLRELPAKLSLGVFRSQRIGIRPRRCARTAKSRASEVNSSMPLHSVQQEICVLTTKSSCARIWLCWRLRNRAQGALLGEGGSRRSNRRSGPVGKPPALLIMKPKLPRVPVPKPTRPHRTRKQDPARKAKHKKRETDQA